MLSGVDLVDSVRVNIGSDNDLALFHTGSNGVIHNATGELRIRANTLKLQDYTNEDLMIVANSNSSVDLYHNNQKKFETSATGATVTGNLAVTGDLDITGNVNSYNVTDLDVTDQTITLGAGQTEANSGGSGIIIDGSSASILWDETNDTFDINKGLTALGNVGIGTDSPSAKFVVSNSGAGGFEFTPDTTAFSVANSNYIASYDRSASAYRDIVFDLGGAESQAVRFKAGGNVGIGTSSPTEKLDVNGGTVIKGSLTNSSGTGSALRMQHSSNISEILSLEPGVAWRELRTNASQQTFYIAGGERMRITATGNVGIGETSPLGKLHIKGSDTGATASAQGNSLILEDSENGLSILSSTAGAGYINFGDSDDNNVGMIIYGHSSNSMSFWTNAAKRATIDASGNLLVGTTNNAPVSNNVAGVSIRNFGEVQSSVDGAAALYLNRKTNDGDIAVFRKDGSTVGSIGADGGSLVIGGGDVGIGFYQSADALVPINGGTRAVRDSAIDLGMSSAKYKDLHLSGTVNAGANVNATGIITSNHMIRSDAGHNTARVEALYDDGAAQYDSNILMWVSEPGYTYDAGGIGVNVHASGHYYGRAYDNDYSVFMRFIKSDGSIQFGQNQGTSGTAGASQTETLKITSNGTLRLATTGGIGFGTTNAADTLDDYEEGTHTATITCSASGTVTL